MSIRSSVRNVMVTAGLASMVMIAVPASVTTAEAGASTGTWRNGMVAGPRGVYGPRYGYAPRYGYGGYYGGYRRYNPGPALAAGLVGGLALGAIAAGSSPYYGAGYGYPAYGAPVYYQPPAYYGRCYWTNRRVYDAWGYAHLRRVQVCN